MSKSYSVVRLEQALHSWENSCFFPEMILKYGSEDMKKSLGFGLTGAIANHSKLRRALLKTSEEFILDDYMGDADVDKYLAESCRLPFDLLLWTRLSRRVFQLSPYSQTLLSAISLERVTWDMVNLPLGSFVINLAEPIKDGLGWEGDCIIFSDVTKLFGEVEEDKRIFNLTLFSTNLSDVKPVSLVDKKKMKRAVVNRDNAKFAIYAKKYFSGCKSDRVRDTSNSQVMRNELITVSQKERVLESFKNQALLEDSDEDMYLRCSVVEKALHQVAVFCLYLDSLKPAQRSGTIEKVKQPKTQNKGTKAITDASEIFLVKCEHIITDAEKLTLTEIRRSREAGGKCVHFRRGYCRRAPGRGNDPDAPRVVIIGPVLVNAKLLMPDTLPVGSKSIMA